MSNGNVLVASNSLFMRVMLWQILGTLDIDVTVAKNIKEVANQLAKKAPDIVLVDLSDEIVGNAEVPQLAKNSDPLCPVIALIPAQHDKPEVIVAMVRAGIDGYIRTPISAEQVKARIEQALRKSE